MLRPSGMVALAVVLATVIATAPATLTFCELPSSPAAEAEEPLVSPAALPPLEVDRSEASLVLSSAFVLTPPPAASLSLLFESPPAELALAVDFELDVVLALSSIAPP